MATCCAKTASGACCTASGPARSACCSGAIPLTAAAYSRAFRFCGSDGVEIMEPLSFKGRRGSGIAGQPLRLCRHVSRAALGLGEVRILYRVWGRLLYNPDAEPELASLSAAAVRRRRPRARRRAGQRQPHSAHRHHRASALRRQQQLLARALPQPIPGRRRPSRPYTDTPAPKVFGNVSPLDPQLFSRINDFADELLTGRAQRQYSPIEVAQWMEDYAADAAHQLAEAAAKATGKDRPEYRRMVIDIELQAGLGRFFGAKFRAGVLYRIHEQTGNRAALEACLKAYRAARDDLGRARRPRPRRLSSPTSPWANCPSSAATGWTACPPSTTTSRWWQPASNMPATPKLPPPLNPPSPKPSAGPSATAISCTHAVPSRFQPGQPIELQIAPAAKLATARLYYRHVTQAERYETVEMTRRRIALACRHSRRLHRRHLPHRILLRVARIPPEGDALPRLRRGPRQPALLRHPLRRLAVQRDTGPGCTGTFGSGGISP